MRKIILAGNWKMCKTNTETKEFIEKLLNKIKIDDNQEIIIAPSFPALAMAKELVLNTKIKIAAQNVHFEEKGAFTGEVSAAMLSDLKVDYVIIGHSERREFFGDTSFTVNKKIKTALKYDLMPIMCCGENLKQREAHIEKAFVKQQIEEGLEGIDETSVLKIVIAYEPIWAIGTGKIATSEEANEMCAFIREILTNLYGKKVAQKIHIQYGGSVKGENISELINQSDVDGALIGGASLEVEDFLEILEKAREIKNGEN